MELPKITTLMSSNSASKSPPNSKNKRTILYRPPVNMHCTINFHKYSNDNSLQETGIVCSENVGCHALSLHCMHFIYVFLSLYINNLKNIFLVKISVKFSVKVVKLQVFYLPNILTSKFTGRSEKGTTVVKYLIWEGAVKHEHSLQRLTRCWKDLIFISKQNWATLFQFQNGFRAWHATVLHCRDHLMVVLCSSLGSAAEEQGARSRSLHLGQWVWMQAASVFYSLWLPTS